MPRMTGRAAIVTGASRGIGQAIAELLAAEGAKVVCVARTRNEGEHPLQGSLAGTVAAIRAGGGEATWRSLGDGEGAAVAADGAADADAFSDADGVSASDRAPERPAQPDVTRAKPSITIANRRLIPFPSRHIVGSGGPRSRMRL